MSSITPCPACGSRRLEIHVKSEAIQRIEVHRPNLALPTEYTYTITHENVTSTEVTSAFCLACPHEWVLELCPACKYPDDYT